MVSACLRPGWWGVPTRIGAWPWGVRIGRADFDDVMLLVGDQLVQGSVYRLLAEHGDALFGDEYFAD